MKLRQITKTFLINGQYTLTDVLSKIRRLQKIVPITRRYTSCSRPSLEEDMPEDMVGVHANVNKKHYALKFYMLDSKRIVFNLTYSKKGESNANLIKKVVGDCFYTSPDYNLEKVAGEFFDV